MAETRRATVAGVDVVYSTPSWKGLGAGLRGVIFQHGHGANAYQNAQGQAFAGHPEFWADRGHVVACISTPDTFDTAASMTTLTALHDWMVNTVGIAGPKIAVAGWSGGGGNVLRWLVENPTMVACGVLFNALYDLDYAEANLFTAEIDGLYGGTHATYLTQGAPRSPLATASSFRGGPKLLVAHSSDDPTIPYSQATGFVSAVNDPAVTLRAPVTGGHQGALLNIPPRESWEFLRTNWAA